MIADETDREAKARQVRASRRRQRVEVDLHLGFLEDRTVSHITRRRYLEAVDQRRVWRSADGVKDRPDDESLARYRSALYFDGRNPAKGRYLLRGHTHCCTDL